jgi:hypothetical protein
MDAVLIIVNVSSPLATLLILTDTLPDIQALFSPPKKGQENNLTYGVSRINEVGKHEDGNKVVVASSRGAEDTSSKWFSVNNPMQRAKQIIMAEDDEASPMRGDDEDSFVDFRHTVKGVSVRSGAT